MRNGKTLLRWSNVMLVVTVVTVGAMFLGTYSAQAAPELEATESGAPSAMVIFPVTDKPNPTGKGMRPAVFNHFIHEKKITACETCHHTGDTVACTSCHTVEGKKEGNFVTLERAMHAENIAKRQKGNTPSSCVSCHTKNLQRRECAGCHNLVPQPKRTEAYCATCHDVSKTMTKEQLALGAAGKLPAEQNEALAAETVAARKPVAAISQYTIPYLVKIDALVDKYEPMKFTHARHVGSLMRRIKDDKLAAAFHNQPATVCGACHHNSPLSATPPKCGSCHQAEIDPTAPARPTLKAAYHLQCMGCHNSMKVARPQDTSCTTCHKERAK